MRAEDVAIAREAGATDLEIHDTVLIAAAFCMFNRYVDGLATTVRPDQAAYEAAALVTVNNGYLPADLPAAGPPPPAGGRGTSHRSFGQK